MAWLETRAGHGSAAARDLSDPSEHSGVAGPFDKEEASKKGGDVDEPIGRDIEIGRVEDLLNAGRPRINREGWWRRHEVADLLGPIRDLEIEHAQARILVSLEQVARAAIAVGPVLPEIVRPEMAALLEVVLVGGDRHGGNAYRIGGGPDVEDPGRLDAFDIDVAHRFVRHNQEVAVVPRQAGMHAAEERRRPVASSDQLDV